jgi:hypothetical protein
MSWFYAFKGEVFRRGWKKPLAPGEIASIGRFMEGAAEIARKAGDLPLAMGFSAKAENLAAALADGASWKRAYA